MWYFGRWVYIITISWKAPLTSLNDPFLILTFSLSCRLMDSAESCQNQSPPGLLHLLITDYIFPSFFFFVLNERMSSQKQQRLVSGSSLYDVNVFLFEATKKKKATAVKFMNNIIFRKLIHYAFELQG